MTPPQPNRAILVVDDQLGIRTSLEFIFKICGYSVECADSGQAALGIARNRNFDGILLDVHMPDMGGLETCARLQEIPSFRARSPKIWFISGAETEIVEKQITESGAAGFFRKPFNHAHLVATVQRSFAQRS